MPEVIREQDQKTSRWSGGTTTELFLHPKNGSYAESNFLFRLSSAYCQDSESVFTSLPGVKRILMVLDGRTSLCHQGKRRVTLEPGDQDRFTGDESIKSVGSCVDFNLMMKQDTDGNLFYRKLQEDEKLSLGDFSVKKKPNLADGCYFGLYLVKGKAFLVRRHKVDKIILKEHDFCMFCEGENLGSWYIKGEKESQIVLAQIECKEQM